MPSQYDKLGEMLKEALENGAIPQKRTKKKSEKSAGSGYSEESSSVFPKPPPTQNGVDLTECVYVSVSPDIMRAYDILELENGTPPDVTKNSYRRLLKKYHPDNIAKFENMQKTAAKKTGEIVKAYKILEEWFDSCKNALKNKG